MSENTREENPIIEPNYIINIAEPVKVPLCRKAFISTHNAAVCIFALSLVAFNVLSAIIQPSKLWTLRAILFVVVLVLFILIWPVTKALSTVLYFYPKTLLIERPNRHIVNRDICIQEFIAYDDIVGCLYDVKQQRLEIHCAYRTLWYDERDDENAPEILNDISDDCCLIDLKLADARKLVEDIEAHSPLSFEII